MSRIAEGQPACWRVAFLTVSVDVDYTATSTKNYREVLTAMRKKRMTLTKKAKKKIAQMAYESAPKLKEKVKEKGVTSKQFFTM